MDGDARWRPQAAYERSTVVKLRRCSASYASAL